MATPMPELNYVKAQRHRAVQDYTNKMGVLGLVSVRVSVPAELAAKVTLDAERARAEWYWQLAENEPDGSDKLLVLAESNRTRPFSQQELDDAVAGLRKAGVSKDDMDKYLDRYRERVRSLITFDTQAARAALDGDDAASIRLRAKTFAASCYVKLSKLEMTDPLVQS